MLPSAGGGGAERVFLTLLQGFDRDRFDLALVLIDPTGPYLSFKPADVRLVGLGYKRVSRAIAKLTLVLRKLRPDVVLSSAPHLNVILLLISPLLRKSTKAFIRESNIASVRLRGGGKASILRLLYRILYPSANGIICPGIAIKEDLKNKFGIPAYKLFTIPNPVNTAAIRSRMKEHVGAFERSKIRLVAAGSLTWQKGFDLLIQATASLVRIRPEIHLTILGDGPEKISLLRQIRSLNLLDTVTLVGFKENPYPYYFHADLFVLPSRWEGLPNVVLESLACGTPVVAFNCPGSIAEIFDDPSQGVLVPVGDIEALTKAIDQWLEEKKHRPKDSLLPARFEIKSVTLQYEQFMMGNVA